MKKREKGFFESNLKEFVEQWKICVKTAGISLVNYPGHGDSLLGS
jgi:hypothetical protein